MTLDDLKPLVKTVVGILRKDNKFLLAQRPIGKPYSGYWEFPGGKIEKNETSFVALKRELWEEIGIEVLQAKFWYHHTHAYPEKIINLELWLVTDFIGQPQGKENQQLQWTSIDEMSQLNLLDANRVIINKIAAVPGLASCGR